MQNGYFRDHGRGHKVIDPDAISNRFIGKIAKCDVCYSYSSKGKVKIHIDR